MPPDRPEAFLFLRRLGFRQRRRPNRWRRIDERKLAHTESRQSLRCCMHSPMPKQQWQSRKLVRPSLASGDPHSSLSLPPHPPHHAEGGAEEPGGWGDRDGRSDHCTVRLKIELPIRLVGIGAWTTQKAGPFSACRRPNKDSVKAVTGVGRPSFCTGSIESIYPARTLVA